MATDLLLLTVALFAFVTFVVALALVFINLWRVGMGVRRGETQSWRLMGNPFNALIFPSALDATGLSARRKLIRWLFIMLASATLLLICAELTGTLA